MQNETVTRLLQELMAELSGDKAEAAVLEEADMKQCIHCHRMLPRSKDFFHGDSAKDDGLKSACKTCDLTRAKIRSRERKLSDVQDQLEALTSKEVELMSELDDLRENKIPLPY